MKILIGNSFPLSLVRRQVKVTPCELDFFKEYVGKSPVASYWGHSNTLKAVNAFTGLDLTPKTERPVVLLNDSSMPTLDGEIFDQAFVISPNYAKGFRPAIGEEVPEDKIKGWQILHIQWL